MSELSRLKERVFETSTSTGTGDITLAGAKTGYQTFNAAYGTGVQFPYTIEDPATGDWEVGMTTLSDASTLVRGGSQTVVASSNSNAAVDFGSGIKQVLSASNTRHAGQFIGQLHANRIAAIGTSLVQHNNEATSGGRMSWSGRGWLSWFRAYLGDAVDIPVWHDTTVYEGWEPSGTPGATRNFQGLNFGVSGQFVTEIEARLAFIDEHYIDEFDAIIVEGGTNDVAGGSASTTLAARKRIVEFFLARGKVVYMVPILLRGTSSWASASDTRKKCNWLNTQVAEYCRGRRNLFYLDWSKPWTDKTTADGVPITSDADGTHFNIASAENVGKFLADYFAQILPPTQVRCRSQDDTYDATHNPQGNILANTFCLGTGGVAGTGASGTVPDGMRVERSSGADCSVVASKEVRYDGEGHYQVLTFTMGGSDLELFYFRTSSANTAHAFAGQWLQASVTIETNDSDMIYGVKLYLQDQASGGLLCTDIHEYPTSGTVEAWPARYRKLQLKTPPMLMRNDSTAVRWRVEIRVKNTGTIAPVVKIGSCELRNVPNPIPASLQ